MELTGQYQVEAHTHHEKTTKGREKKEGKKTYLKTNGLKIPICENYVYPSMRSSRVPHQARPKEDFTEPHHNQDVKNKRQQENC